MTFPETLLPIVVELELDGVWTDITAYVYQRDLIRIIRGRADEASEVAPTHCALTLDNNDGRFSPRNPEGAYHGQIGRNTPIRVSVDIGDSYLLTTGSNASNHGFTAPDEASIDITGDLEVQYDATMDNWHQSGSVELCGKGVQTGDQRSWAFMVRDRHLFFEWSEDGTSTTLDATSTEEIPVPATRRLAVKVTIDVDNGASGHTVTFYWADTIEGTWYPLGEPVVTAGTTSIFSSTADLAVGNAWSTLGFNSPDGKTHAMKLLNGIGGTEVANPDFRIQTPGDTEFTDAAGLVWTQGSSLSPISNRKTRFVGEVAKWTVEWETGGDDVYTKVDAYGERRRLGRGVSPLQSTLRRRIPTDANLIAYWPLEDGVNTTRPASPLDGVPAMIINRLAFQSDDTLDGSDSLPTLTGTSTDNSYITGYVPEPDTGFPIQWRVEFVFRMDELPATGPWTVMRITTRDTEPGTGSSDPIVEWRIQINDAGGAVKALDDDGTLRVNDTFTWGSIIPEGDDWYRLAFQVEADINSSDWALYFIRVADSSELLTGSFLARTGTVQSVGGPPDGYHPDLTGAAIGHIAVFDELDSTIFNSADHGFNGETARARLERIATEEGLTVNVYGVGSELMGAQRPEDLLTILQQCADSDQGMLGEERESVATQYLSRTVLYDQNPACTLDYTGSDGLVVPITPASDDRFVRNQIEVTRDGGTNQQVELSTGGPLAIDEVGRYFDSWNLNLSTDPAALQAAGWKLHLGTWDEDRWTQITVLLQNAVDRIDDVTALDLGAVLAIDNPPSWLPPDLVETMIQGYEETLHQYRWEFTFNTSPALAWRTAHVGATDDADDLEAVRADTAGSELLEALTTTETAADVHSSGKYRWVDSATYPDDFPFDLNIGGERVTCTAIAPYVQDTFTRSETDTWGTPTIGPAAWGSGGGTSADFDVNGSAGTHTLATVNFSRRSFLSAVHDDFDIVVDIATSALATGASLQGGPTARYTDSDNLYQARVEFTTSQAINLKIIKRTAAVNTDLEELTTGLTHVAGTFYRVRFRGRGDDLTARIWPVADPEPTHWDLIAEDVDQTASNFVGVYSVAASGNTNVNPQVQYDNFQILDQQVMTLTRSVNGVVKEHADGADVRLWVPPIIAL